MRHGSLTGTVRRAAGLRLSVADALEGDLRAWGRLYNLPAYLRIGITGFAPDGIAVAANGTIYLDTSPADGYASKTALIEIRPDGTVHVLWES